MFFNFKMAFSLFSDLRVCYFLFYYSESSNAPQGILFFVPWKYFTNRQNKLITLAPRRTILNILFQAMSVTVQHILQTLTMQNMCIKAGVGNLEKPARFWKHPNEKKKSPPSPFRPPTKTTPFSEHVIHWLLSGCKKNFNQYDKKWL